MKIGEVEYKGLKFKYRHDTTDWGIIKEACGGLNTRFFDVKPGEYWFDIGAHIGAFTCYALSKGAIVEAFEPVPDNFCLLKQNVAINGFVAPQVELWNSAITKNGGFIKLFIDTNNYGNCSIYERGTSQTIIVDSFPTSDFDKDNPYCLKVDTEGCEYEILSGLDLTNCQKLILENHYWLQPKENTIGIIKLMNDYFNHYEEYGGYMCYAWK